MTGFKPLLSAVKICLLHLFPLFKDSEVFDRLLCLSEYHKKHFHSGVWREEGTAETAAKPAGNSSNCLLQFLSFDMSTKMKLFVQL